MKKLISLLLCALMLAPLSLTAFALPPEDNTNEPLATCNHDFQGYHDVSEEKITDFGDGTCGYKVNQVGKCRLCGRIDSLPTDRKTGVASHSYSLYHATCNGYDQTWYYHCKRGCGAGKTEIQRCHMAGHAGGCQWLPV